MITEKKLAEWRAIYNATEKVPSLRIDVDAWDVIETLSAALKVVRAVKENIQQNTRETEEALFEALAPFEEEK